MSLRVESGGILETAVTWQETERAIQEALATRASFGPAKSATHIGDGNGFLSKIAIIDPDWQGEEVERDDRLPATFVLKMASCLKTASMMQEEDTFGEEKWAGFEDFVRKTHNLESAFYEFARPWASEVSIPRCFYTTRFSETNQVAGAIAMEHLKNASIKHLHHRMSVRNMKEIARELGRIQAFAHRHKIVESVPEIAERDMHAEFWSTLTFEVAEDMLQRLKLLNVDDERLKNAVDDTVAILPLYYIGNLASTLHEQLGITPVIVNGDLWSANVMLDDETDDVVALIDWQLVHVGCGVEDLLRAAFAGLNTADRRAAMPALLEEMHAGLVEKMEHGKAPPYTLEELRDTFEVLFAHCAIFFFPLVAYVSQANAAGLSEEEKAARTDVVYDKTLGLLEDLHTFHARNLKDTRKLRWKKE